MAPVKCKCGKRVCRKLATVTTFQEELDLIKLALYPVTPTAVTISNYSGYKNNYMVTSEEAVVAVRNRIAYLYGEYDYDRDCYRCHGYIQDDLIERGFPKGDYYRFFVEFLTAADIIQKQITTYYYAPIP